MKVDRALGQEMENSLGQMPAAPKASIFFFSAV
jgi:hypothetical protein